LAIIIGVSQFGVSLVLVVFIYATATKFEQLGRWRAVSKQLIDKRHIDSQSTVYVKRPLALMAPPPVSEHNDKAAVHRSSMVREIDCAVSGRMSCSMRRKRVSTRHPCRRGTTTVLAPVHQSVNSNNNNSTFTSSQSTWHRWP
jgi:hypothetical protein